MSRQVTCPKCGRPCRFKEEAAGKQGRCALCGAAVWIPGTRTTTEPMLAAAPSVSKEHGFQLIDECHQDAREAISAWPERVSNIYFTGAKSFMARVARATAANPVDSPECVEELGVTVDEFLKVSFY